MISDVLFGCANESDYIIMNDTRFNGVIGLGYHSESLVKKLGDKFSYCVGDITDPTYPYSQLRLGGGIEFEGDHTPMEVGGVYRVSLESISIGGERLTISPHEAVIDTGTVTTRLAYGYYVMIQDKFRSILNGLGLRELVDINDHTNFCYRGNVKTDLVGFPLD